MGRRDRIRPGDQQASRSKGRKRLLGRRGGDPYGRFKEGLRRRSGGMPMRRREAQVRALHRPRSSRLMRLRLLGVAPHWRARPRQPTPRCCGDGEPTPLSAVSCRRTDAASSSPQTLAQAMPLACGGVVGIGHRWSLLVDPRRPRDGPGHHQSAVSDTTGAVEKLILCCCPALHRCKEGAVTVSATGR